MLVLTLTLHSTMPSAMRQHLARSIVLALAVACFCDVVGIADATNTNKLHIVLGYSTGHVGTESLGVHEHFTDHQHVFFQFESTSRHHCVRDCVHLCPCVLFWVCMNVTLVALLPVCRCFVVLPGFIQESPCCVCMDTWYIR